MSWFMREKNINNDYIKYLLRFIVDRRIFVVGFGLYGSIHGPSEYDVTIQLLHTGSGMYGECKNENPFNQRNQKGGGGDYQDVRQGWGDGVGTGAGCYWLLGAGAAWKKSQ